jgi:NADH-quinone oxidoreductase subunit A
LDNQFTNHDSGRIAEALPNWPWFRYGQGMDLETKQFLQYVPVLILFLVATAFAAGALVFSYLLGTWGKRTKIKDTAYECGMLPVGEGNSRLSVKFYLVAMLFILFDIEVVFLYPWAVVYRELLAKPETSTAVAVSMFSFLGILLVGYIYALKKKAFDWKN